MSALITESAAQNAPQSIMQTTNNSWMSTSILHSTAQSENLSSTFSVQYKSGVNLSYTSLIKATEMTHEGTRGYVTVFSSSRTLVVTTIPIAATISHTFMTLTAGSLYSSSSPPGVVKPSLVSSISWEASSLLQSALDNSTLLISSASQSYPVSSSVSICTGNSCDNNKTSPKDDDFTYMIIGISVGSGGLIIVLVIVFCYLRRRNKKRLIAHHRRTGRKSGGIEDEWLEIKESVFNSSTLQIGKGVCNDGLEMDDSLLRIISNSPRDSSSTFQRHCAQPEPLQVHVNMEQTERPSSIHTSAQPGSNKELKYNANIRLLQDWENDLADQNSERYQELKNDVESSIRDVYKLKEEFNNVTVEGFRKGSVIVDLSLSLLAVDENPLELLEEAVSQGKISHLVVDKNFSVARQSDNDKSSHGKHQPYMQQSRGQNDQSERNTEEADQFTNQASSLNPAKDEASASLIDSVNSNDFKSNDEQMSELVEKSHSTQAITNENEPKFDVERPTSLLDLTRVGQLQFRDQRDSGIGSMQELNKYDGMRSSRQDIHPENAEQVFYDIPETCEAISQQNYADDKSILIPKARTPAEQGIAHVALFDFHGNDSRELSIKQGETLYVTQKESLGWVKVVNSDNYRGWVPTSYLVIVSQSQLASTQQTVETLEFFDNVLDQLEDGSEMDSVSPTSTPDHNVELVKNIAEDSDKVNEVDDHEYAIVLPEEPDPVNRCKSVYAFTASDKSEMSFEEGTIIDVLKTTKAGWWKGKIHDREGWFPSSYVLLLKEAADEVWNGESVDEMQRNSEKEPDKQVYDEVTYEVPAEISNEVKEENYQSLKRQFVPPENYANLYLQILRRESHVENDMEKYAAALQVKLKEADPERPLRIPPVPPREEPRDQPAVPPRQKSASPPSLKEEKKIKELPKKPKRVLSPHGEPPKRPVPPPPTAKPTLNIAANRVRCKDDVIFLDKDLRDRVLPTKVSYENMPKKPKRSPEAIRSANVKRAVPVMVQSNELTAECSSSHSNGESVEMKKGNIKLTRDSDQANRPHVPLKPVVETAEVGTRRSEPVPKSRNSPVEVKAELSKPTPFNKPSKPLPKLESTEISKTKYNDKEVTTPSVSDEELSPVKARAFKKPVKPLPDFDSTDCSKRGDSSPLAPLPKSKPVVKKAVSSPQKAEDKGRPALAKKPSVEQSTKPIISGKGLSKSDVISLIPLKPTVSSGSQKPTVLDKPQLDQKHSQPTNTSSKTVQRTTDKPVLSTKPEVNIAAKPTVSETRSPKVGQSDAKKNRGEQIQGVTTDTRTEGKAAIGSKKDDVHVKPVPAKRIKKISDDIDVISANNVESSSHNENKNTPAGDSDALPSEKIEETAVPTPRPRIVKNDKNVVKPKTKPQRPSSPPVKETSKSKPDRPPLPSSAQSSPIKTVASAMIAKDKSKLRKVIKQYSKTSQKEIDLVVGELIFELASEADYSYGLLENGLEGWYPVSHVAKLDEL
eukprot:gene7242-8050_t